MARGSEIIAYDPTEEKRLIVIQLGGNCGPLNQSHSKRSSGGGEITHKINMSDYVAIVLSKRITKLPSVVVLSFVLWHSCQFIAIIIVPQTSSLRCGLVEGLCCYRAYELMTWLQSSEKGAHL